MNFIEFEKKRYKIIGILKRKYCLKYNEFLMLEWLSQSNKELIYIIDLRKTYSFINISCLYSLQSLGYFIKKRDHLDERRIILKDIDLNKIERDLKEIYYQLEVSH